MPLTQQSFTWWFEYQLIQPLTKSLLYWGLQNAPPLWELIQRISPTFILKWSENEADQPTTALLSHIGIVEVWPRTVLTILAHRETRPLQSRSQNRLLCLLKKANPYPPVLNGTLGAFSRGPQFSSLVDIHRLIAAHQPTSKCWYQLILSSSTSWTLWWT